MITTNERTAFSVRRWFSTSQMRCFRILQSTAIESGQIYWHRCGWKRVSHSRCLQINDRYSQCRSLGIQSDSHSLVNERQLRRIRRFRPKENFNQIDRRLTEKQTCPVSWTRRTGTELIYFWLQLWLSTCKKIISKCTIMLVASLPSMRVGRRTTVHISSEYVSAVVVAK